MSGSGESSRSAGPPRRIEAARQGDVQAQTELSHEIRELARVICRPRSGVSSVGEFDWEDVAQEACQRLFSVGLSLYRGTGPERSYLYTFVKVAWLQALRRERRRAKRERSATPEREVAAPQTQRVELSSVLDRLDSPCQDLLRSVYLEGVSYRELATEAKMEESSIRARTSRCLSKLRDLAREEES